MKAFAFFLKDDTPGKNWLPMITVSTFPISTLLNLPHIG